MSITQKNYDFLVIGSGISGMTLALLLAKTGAKVAVLEKSAAIGGSMQRFSRNGCPLDTGFHFTTSLTGAFGDMFHFLEMKEYLKEITVDKKNLSGRSRQDVSFAAWAREHFEILCCSISWHRRKTERFF